MTKIINLFGGPGSGKSTTAAGLFHRMKLAGYKVELVTEFAKQLTYQKRYAVLANNQAYVHAKQLHYLDTVVGQVDYIITDSPTLLSVVYAKDSYPHSFKQFVIDIFNLYDNLNVAIKRVKEYQPYGRSQTLVEAQEIDDKIYKTLIFYKIPFIVVEGNENAVNQIFNLINNKVSEK
jgi:adenylate kinase family enzyme